MKGVQHRGAFAAVLVGSLVVACSSPIDLSAISKYASTTAQAGTSFAALAADFKGSCLRHNEAVDHLIETTANAPVLTLIGEPSLSELTDAASIEAFPRVAGYQYVPPTNASAQGTAAPAALPDESDCSTAGNVSDAWNKANATVLDYVQALGNLANVDAVPTPNPAPLASPLAKVGVPAAAIQASSSILTTIAAFFTQRGSERNIRSFLAEVDPSMSDGIGALEIVDAAYAIELNNEYTQIGLCYGNYARRELALYAGIKGTSLNATNERARIANALVREKAAVVGALQLVNSQSKATIAYGAAIEAILKTHEQLYKTSRGRARLADYANVVQSTGAQVVTNLEALAKAVK